MCMHMAWQLLAEMSLILGGSVCHVCHVCHVSCVSLNGSHEKELVEI